MGSRENKFYVTWIAGITFGMLVLILSVVAIKSYQQKQDELRISQEKQRQEVEKQRKKDDYSRRFNEALLRVQEEERLAEEKAWQEKLALIEEKGGGSIGILSVIMDEPTSRKEDGTINWEVVHEKSREWDRLIKSMKEVKERSERAQELLEGIQRRHEAVEKILRKEHQ